MNGRQTEDIIFTSCSTTGRASWAATAPSTNQSNCSEQMRVRLQPEVKEWNVDESDNDLFISVHANVLIVYDCKIFCELRRLSVRSLQHEMTLLQSFLRFAFSLLCNVLLLRVVVDGSVSQKKQVQSFSDINYWKVWTRCQNFFTSWDGTKNMQIVCRLSQILFVLQNIWELISSDPLLTASSEEEGGVRYKPHLQSQFAVWCFLGVCANTQSSSRLVHPPEYLLRSDLCW